MGYRLIESCRIRVSVFTLALFLISIFLPAPAAAFSIKDEAELGSKIRLAVRSQFPIVEDPEVVRYIEGLVKRLEAKVPPQPFPFSINVVRHNVVNAFASPGGNLFIFTGLILAMDTEAELAGVVAHEMAHSTQRHIAGRVAQMQKVTILSLAGAIAGAFLGGNAGPAVMSGALAAGQSSLLSYSRADEAEADQVGMTYLVGAGFPPQGMIGAFEKIRRNQWLLGVDIPTYLSTHPGVVERITALTARIQTLPASVKNQKNDDTQFLRIQALIRARYAGTDQALAVFNRQENSAQKCLALMGKGIIASRQNKIQDATLFFDQAMACDAREQLIVREAGIHHYMKGDQTRSATLLQQAVTMNPRDHMALFFYARMLSDRGNLASAQEYFREILRHLPDDAEIHEFYARTLAKDKKMFPAYLHMAYSGMYAMDMRRAERNFNQAKDIAQTDAERQDLKRYENILKERKEILGK